MEGEGLFAHDYGAPADASDVLTFAAARCITGAWNPLLVFQAACRFDGALRGNGNISEGAGLSAWLLLASKGRQHRPPIRVWCSPLVRSELTPPMKSPDQPPSDEICVDRRDRRSRYDFARLWLCLLTTEAIYGLYAFIDGSFR